MNGKQQYDFIKKTVTELQVKSIIKKAGYNPEDFTYHERVDKDGYLVEGNKVMSLTSLRNAAKALNIKNIEIVSGPVLGSAADAASDAGTPYQVTINLDSTTVGDLVTGNYQLYGFKAVQTTQGGGAPLVWFSTDQFMAETVVSWEEQYQAYTSLSQIITNGQIQASSPYDITLDQTLNVAANGVGNVTEGGTTGAISIFNTTSQQFTCGISEVQDGTALPMCAFPLYGHGLDVIAPIEKVLLMFSTLPVKTGTVIEQAYSQGILIDLTGNNEQTVSFDINEGWSWGGYSWAQAIPASANLVPLLIEQPSAALTSNMLARSQR